MTAPPPPPTSISYSEIALGGVHQELNPGWGIFCRVSISYLRSATSWWPRGWQTVTRWTFAAVEAKMTASISICLEKSMHACTGHTVFFLRLDLIYFPFFFLTTVRSSNLSIIPIFFFFPNRRPLIFSIASLRFPRCWLLPLELRRL